MEKPLTAKILSNPNHPITRHILYIYSMETFIYADLNQACRMKDQSKIQFYGAFAAALSYILYSANINKKDHQVEKQVTLFRGLKMHPMEADSYQEDTVINLVGYTSTSKRFGTALHFAKKDIKDDQIPVVFEIQFKGKSGLFELDDDITAYPGEQEVLLQDGFEYRILSNKDIETKNTGNKFRLIKLRYPA